MCLWWVFMIFFRDKSPIFLKIRSIHTLFLLASLIFFIFNYSHFLCCLPVLDRYENEVLGLSVDVCVGASRISWEAIAGRRMRRWNLDFHRNRQEK